MKTSLVLRYRGGSGGGALLANSLQAAIGKRFAAASQSATATSLIVKPRLEHLNEINTINEVTKHVNDRMLSDKWSRRFAIVMIAGSQFKVTTEDVIVVRNSFYPTIGDRIRLEKVMLVGDSDFSLVGKPLVSKELVRVEATVIEKTLTNPTIIFRYQPRKDNRTMNFFKGTLTLLRINSIEFTKPLDLQDQQIAE